MKEPIKHSQYPLHAVEQFAYDDTMEDTNGNEVELSSSGANTFTLMHLPHDAIIVGGSLVVTEASTDTGTHTIDIGDEDDATRYASGVNLKSAAQTMLTLTGHIHSSRKPLQMTITPANGDADAGKFYVDIQHIRLNRSMETHAG